MDSKIIIVTFCVLLAASLKSETEAVASHNPDFNGKRSSVLVNFILFFLMRFLKMCFKIALFLK